jgi:hypothetical protein
MLDDGASATDISLSLAHAHLATTEHYLKTVILPKEELSFYRRCMGEGWDIDSIWGLTVFEVKELMKLNFLMTSILF